MSWLSVFQPADQRRQRFPQVAFAFAKEAGAVVLSAADFGVARGGRDTSYEIRIK